MKENIRGVLIDGDLIFRGAGGKPAEEIAAVIAALGEHEVRVAIVARTDREVEFSRDHALVTPDPGLCRRSDGVDLDYFSRLMRVPSFHLIYLGEDEATLRRVRGAGAHILAIGDPGRASGADILRRYPLSVIDIPSLLRSGRPERNPVDEVSIIESFPDAERPGYWETLFSLTNGYLGLRGDHEELTLAENDQPALFINGVYEYRPYRHVVSFPGYPDGFHGLVNLMRITGIEWRLGEGRITPFASGVSEYRRYLDLQRGLLRKEYLVDEAASGTKVRIESERFVSRAELNLAAQRYALTVVDGGGTAGVKVAFELPVPSRHFPEEYRRDLICRGDAGRMEIGFATRASGIEVLLAAACRLTVNGREIPLVWREEADGVFASVELELQRGDEAVFERYARLSSSVDETLVPGEEECRKPEPAGLPASGWGAALAEHEAAWSRLREHGAAAISGAPEDQQALAFSLFQLLQNCPADGRRSVSATGVTGDGYAGHIFWDTEMYMVPCYSHTAPELARGVLHYRYLLLEKARERARQLDGRGALYAWNSIDGSECGVVFEASTAEYHINSAVAYAVWYYATVTQDREFLLSHGAEIVFETARFLFDLGHYSAERGGAFCISAVCGPDEYACGVDNNYYTNRMAQWHFTYAARLWESLGAECASLAGRIGLTESEVDAWARAAEAVYLPRSAELGICMQDDGYLGRKPVDMETIPFNYDIRELFHPLNLWRMQVTKQADVLLALYLFSGEYSTAEIERNYLYYEPRTNHGSSLSPAIHSVTAAAIGRMDEALEFFRASARMDLDDFKGNTAKGVHTAACGGTWLALVAGYGGLRIDESGYRLDPVCPDEWDGYRFRLRQGEAVMEVAVDANMAAYTLRQGESFSFRHGSRPVLLKKESLSSCGFPLRQSDVRREDSRIH